MTRHIYWWEIFCRWTAPQKPAKKFQTRLFRKSYKRSLFKKTFHLKSQNFQGCNLFHNIHFRNKSFVIGCFGNFDRKSFWRKNKHFCIGGWCFNSNCFDVFDGYVYQTPFKKNLNIVVMETMKVAYKKDSQDVYEIKLRRKKSAGVKTIYL